MNINLNDKCEYKYFITGGCGMIGSNLVRAMCRDGKDVYVVDDLSRGKLENLIDNTGRAVIDIDTHFIKADLTDFRQAKSALRDADIVIHLADVVAGIKYIFSNQGEVFRANNLINSNVFAVCREMNVKGVLYVGTACSFPLTRQNSLNQKPLREEELFPAMPESAYGWSKLIGQIELEYLQKETGIPVCILIFHNVYGYPTDYSEKGQVIPSLMRKAIRYPDEQFEVWGSGTQGRAFLYIDDVIEAILLALQKGWNQGAIQIGPNECTSIKEISEYIIEISGKDIQPFFDTSKPEGDKARCADYSKAYRVLGWQPETSIKDGLEKVYRWIEQDIKG